MFVGDFSHAGDHASEFRSSWVHVTVRGADNIRVVMCAQRLIITKTYPDRLVAAIHRYEVKIKINQQITFGGATANAQWFFMAGFAE
jgi:hypothetical protein